MEYQFFTYIVSSESAVLYVWMTNNLLRRIQEHKEGVIEGFSKKYWCKKLVYYETTKYIYNAIEREKEIKWWRREKKVVLIESRNPGWKELYNGLVK
jgi:putative endonuclease